MIAIYRGDWHVHLFLSSWFRSVAEAKQLKSVCQISRHPRKRHSFFQSSAALPNCLPHFTFSSRTTSKFSFLSIALSVSHSKDIFFEIKKHRCIILFVLSCSRNVLKKVRRKKSGDAYSVLCFSVPVWVSGWFYVAVVVELFCGVFYPGNILYIYIFLLAVLGKVLVLCNGLYESFEVGWMNRRKTQP